MSAFMCSKETLWDMALYFAKYYPCEWGHLLEKEAGVIEIYKALAELNVKSLIARYGESAVPEMTGPLSELYSYEGDLDEQETDNLCVEMSCYLYQSCEGDCDEDPIYGLTQEIFNDTVRDALFSKLDDDVITIYWR